MIYLDYAATNPFTKHPCSKYGQFLNPNANYAYKEQKLLDGCANMVKAAIGVKSGKVVFGGTSSQLIENLMNWEVNGKRRFTEYVIGSTYEHDSFDRFLVNRVGSIKRLEDTIVKNRGFRGWSFFTTYSCIKLSRANYLSPKICSICMSYFS